MLRRVSDLPQTDLFSCRNSTRGSSRHMHFDFSLGVLEAGVSDCLYRGVRQRIGPGTVTLVVPGETHAAKPVTGCANRAIRLDAAKYADYCRQVLGKAPAEFQFSASVYSDRPLAKQVLSVYDVLARGHSTMEREYGLLSLMTFLLTRYSENRPDIASPPKDRRRMRLACDYIQEHYAENITLGQLAKLVDLSPFHFARVFCHTVGVPPHTYQVQARLNRARILLAAGKQILYAAQEAGFYDQSHLVRAFKAQFGVTPVDYRSSAT